MVLLLHPPVTCPSMMYASRSLLISGRFRNMCCVIFVLRASSDSRGLARLLRAPRRPGIPRARLHTESTSGTPGTWHTPGGVTPRRLGFCRCFITRCSRRICGSLYHSHPNTSRGQEELYPIRVEFLAGSGKYPGRIHSGRVRVPRCTVGLQAVRFSLLRSVFSFGQFAVKVPSIRCKRAPPEGGSLVQRRRPRASAPTSYSPRIKVHST
eukprot:1191297-Prorocentrum_minimum.AAC.1